MGKKAGDVEQAGRRPGTAASGSSTLCPCTTAVGEALSAKCIMALLVGVGVFLSAFFLLFHLRSPGNNMPDDPGTLIGEIQASFILLKPPAELASHAAMLEQEINRQIGVSNSKVSVSMRTYLENATIVDFGVLPDLINTSISAQSMHILRKNLIQLTLQQLNLSLTPAVFGDPFCIQMLGFPGGVTMEFEAPLPNSTAEVVRPIFNITLEKSIGQLRRLIEEMKKDLGHMLLEKEEDIYIDLTNKNGSTIAPPVIVQVSLSPDDRSIYDEEGRLKKLAELITESSSRNLGLNRSVFGTIKDLNLAPCLQDLDPSFAPSSSPTPMSSPSMHPYSQPTTINLCEHCSCLAWMTMPNATNPHRKLMQLPPTTTSLQLPTWLRSRNGPGHKLSGNAVAAPTFIVPSSQPVRYSYSQA